MKLRRKATQFENAPEGTYPALITVVADLGTQEGFDKRKEMIGISFELAGPTTTGGRPFSVNECFTASLHEKGKLYPVIRAALGAVPEGDAAELDPRALLGKPVLLEVLHRTANDGKTWANVGSVMKLPKGMDAPTTDTELLFFDLEEPDQEVFKKLPALFKKRIENRVQEEPVGADSDLDADVPF